MKTAYYYIMRNDGYAFKDRGNGMADKEAWGVVPFDIFDTREEAQSKLDAFDPTHETGFTVESIGA